MEYSKEYFDDVVLEILPFIKDHWAEVALNKEEVPLDVDLSRYKQLEDLGILDIFTARDGKDLVGYCITFTMKSHQHKSTLASNVDSFYIRPSHRGKMAGTRLVSFTEDCLKSKGSKYLAHHVKTANDFSPLLIRKGYKESERIYTKYIGEM